MPAGLRSHSVRPAAPLPASLSARLGSASRPFCRSSRVSILVGFGSALIFIIVPLCNPEVSCSLIVAVIFILKVGSAFFIIVLPFPIVFFYGSLACLFRRMTTKNVAGFKVVASQRAPAAGYFPVLSIKNKSASLC
jgi:hypothetical protein